MKSDFKPISHNTRILEHTSNCVPLILHALLFFLNPRHYYCFALPPFYRFISCLLFLSLRLVSWSHFPSWSLYFRSSSGQNSTGNKSSQFLLVWMCLYFSLVLLSLGWWLFYVNTSKILSWTLAFISVEICFQSNCHSFARCSLFFFSFYSLIFVLDVLQFDYNVSRCDFFLFILFSIHFA